MNKDKKDFEQMISENLNFQRLGFIESSIHPVREDEIYVFSEYKRLREIDIPELGLTIGRRKKDEVAFIIIESDSLHPRYKFKSKSIPLIEVISTLENYLKNIRNGHKYEFDLEK